MKYVLKLFLIGGMPWFSLAGTKRESVSELNQVFYHQSGPADASIELGKIVFYFSKDLPLLQPEIVQTCDAGIKKVTFKFTAAHATPTVVAAARTLFRKIDKNLCSIDLSVHTGKKPAIILRIAYNPDQVGFESELFDAIKHEKGFMCTLLNKPLLKRLSPENSAILRVVSNDTKRGIVIDMGHGGTDYGAFSLQSIPEKDITLGIGMKLSSLLRSQGFDVFCTRCDDRFVPLDRRTTLCNTCQKADILVSIHANSGNSNACGIETFCYKPQGKKIVTDLTHQQQQKYMTEILSKRYDQSLALAQLIQSGLIDQVKKKQHTVVDRGVKQAVSQMLLGVTKPVILAEVGFVTHPVESVLLASDDYQYMIARGILNGICAYFKQSVSL